MKKPPTKTKRTKRQPSKAAEPSPFMSPRENREHVAEVLLSALRQLREDTLAPPEGMPAAKPGRFEDWLCAWVQFGDAARAEGVLSELGGLLWRMENAARPFRNLSAVTGARAQGNPAVAYVIRSAPDSMHWLHSGARRLWKLAVVARVVKDTEPNFDAFVRKLRSARSKFRRLRAETGGTISA